MSRVILTKWGNSVGIRIPAGEMKAARTFVGAQFDIITDGKGGFILKPIKKIREGWKEAFNAIADSNHDELLMDEVENDFDRDEWKW